MLCLFQKRISMLSVLCLYLTIYSYLYAILISLDLGSHASAKLWFLYSLDGCIVPYYCRRRLLFKFEDQINIFLLI